MIPLFPIETDQGKEYVATDQIIGVRHCVKKGFEPRCLIYVMGMEWTEIKGKVEEVSALWYQYCVSDVPDEDDTTEEMDSL
jgi:hypothetical protein